MYRRTSSIIISLLIINPYVLSVLAARADTTKSLNVPSHGVITYSDDLNISQYQSKNLIKNPNFTNNMDYWGVYPEEVNWWSIDTSVYYSYPASLKCVLPERQNDGIYDPLHSGGWSHSWNVRIPVQAGERVKAYGVIKTERVWAQMGFDFRDANGKITRGFNGIRTSYNSDWTKVKLESDSDIRGVDYRTPEGQETLVVQEGEVSVIFKFVLKKEYGDKTSGTAWFDNAELYIISPP